MHYKSLISIKQLYELQYVFLKFPLKNDEYFGNKQTMSQSIKKCSY